MSKKTLFMLSRTVPLVVAATLSASPAHAQETGALVHPVACAPSPFLNADDPLWGPGPYPYAAAYPNGACLSANVRVLATPKQADVYVDGFFAGFVDDFDGREQPLPITPGDHAITLYREGYRTVTRHIAATARSTVKLQLRMEKLGPGETSELPPPALFSGGLPAR
jgi:PEGA domain